jgi:signal transduction histidine kinase
MIERLRRLAARLWPVPRLRWMLLAVLLFVAALPGVAALGLRVYENALVRRTEAELAAQAAALAASAALLWPGAESAAAAPDPPEPDPRWVSYEEVETGIDLNSTPVLPERPGAVAAPAPPDPEAYAAARRLAPAIAETKQTTLASILLLDRRGTLLNGRDAGLSLAMLPEVRVALGGSARTVLRHNNGYARVSPLQWLSRATDIRLHHARPIRVNGRVVGAVLVSRSPSALFRGMWEDRGKIALGVAAILALLLGLTAILARAIVAPVERLSAASQALARGSSAAPRRPTLQVREIRGLYDDFALMAAAIARRSRYLRDFAASLSHEFKTPLAGIRGGIELLQDHGPAMAPEERARFLTNMEGDVQRLSRLVSRLMELAQADMRRAGASDAASLAPVLARLRDAHGGADFAVALDLPARLPALAMEQAALETVLATLIENARQAGASRLAVTARLEGGMVAIALSDDGPGVPPGDAARIFDPFFTSKREHGGTGLGLPIARALAESCGGSLELVPGEAGARFVLTLPAAP